MAVPTQPDFIPQAWASGTGNYDTIPATQQEAGRASWDGGFPLENTIPVAQGGVPANYRDFQGVLNALSLFAVFQQAGGIFSYSSTIDYPVGAIVLSGGETYQSLSENGPNTTAGVKAVSDTSYWLNVTASNYLPLAGGTMTGSIVYNGFLQRGNSSSSVAGLCGGTGTADGAYCFFRGMDATNGTKGEFSLYANNGTVSKNLNGRPDGTFTWNGQAIQTSSDERLKTAFGDVPDEVLDVWGKVNWQQFKFIADVERKGIENCRWHPGLVAQRVKAVFEAEGLDGCAYGILCHEVWDDEYDEESGELIREAGDQWYVRYEEALAMEAAYQRRRADRLEERIARLEALLDADNK